MNIRKIYKFLFKDRNIPTIIAIVILGCFATISMANAFYTVPMSTTHYRVSLNPSWPTDLQWNLIDNDPDDAGGDDFRDVISSYYYFNDDYLFLRLECVAPPDFTAHPEGRYKWFIDTAPPSDIVLQGGSVYNHTYLFFVEDTPKPGGDGIGDIYLLNDLDSDGSIDDDYSDHSIFPGKITDSNAADYRIVDNYMDLYIKFVEIDDPSFLSATWATDNENSNLDQAPNLDRSEIFFDESNPKADISITKSDNVDPVNSGGYLTYTINVTNYGPDASTNVEVRDTLPSGVSFISSSPSVTGGSFPTYWWIIPSIPAGSWEIITVDVQVDISTSGVITNIVEAINDTRDLLQGNNVFSEDTMIILCEDNDFDGWTTCENDCNDTDPSINPGATEILCDGIDNDCDPLTLDSPDNDGDGYGYCVDCNDTDPLINPGATEILCDGIDNDCDPLTLDSPDNDGDGYGYCDDCNDTDPLINPGATEECDGIDNDCDGVIDEDCEPGISIEKYMWDEDAQEWIVEQISDPYDQIRVTKNSTHQFKITIINTGGQFLDYTVIDDLSSQFNYTNGSSIPLADFESSKKVIWNGNLNIGETINFTYSAQAVELCYGWNTANVTATSAMGNVSDEITLPVKVIYEGQPFIDITKQVKDAQGIWTDHIRCRIDDELQFRIIIDNTMNDPVSNITVTDILPSIAEYVIGSSYVD